MNTDPSSYSTDSGSQAPGPSAIVVSRYNDSITSVMLDGAIKAYINAGGDVDSLAILEAPGAFELVSIASVAAGSGMYESVVCLGCVIKGETSHDLHISNAVAVGIAEISIKTGVPVAFGVLTTNTIEQARARAGGEAGNKGAEAMDAVLGAAGAIAVIQAATQQNTPGIRYTPGIDVPDKAATAVEGV